LGCLKANLDHAGLSYLGLSGEHLWPYWGGVGVKVWEIPRGLGGPGYKVWVLPGGLGFLGHNMWVLPRGLGVRWA
jgi:hypothetical protein